MCMCCVFDIIDPRPFRGEEPTRDVTGPNHVLTLKKMTFEEAKRINVLLLKLVLKSYI